MPHQPTLFPHPRKHTRLPGDGYAATPGSGPEGMQCRDCRHCERKTSESGRRYTKCALVKRTWSKRTDIRLDAPACTRFEQHTQE